MRWQVLWPLLLLLLSAASVTAFLPQESCSNDTNRDCSPNSGLVASEDTTLAQGSCQEASIGMKAVVFGATGAIGATCSQLPEISLMWLYFILWCYV